MASVPESQFAQVKTLFEKAVYKRGIKPLKKGIEIAIFVDDNGPITLTQQDGEPKVLATPPYSADLTFWVPGQALESLSEESSEDVGEVGVALLKLMAHPDPLCKIRAKVHVGFFEFLRGGYLGVLSLGGTTVMKYLASKGLDGIGKIREAISKLRN